MLVRLYEITRGYKSSHMYMFKFKWGRGPWPVLLVGDMAKSHGKETGHKMGTGSEQIVTIKHGHQKLNWSLDKSPNSVDHKINALFSLIFFENFIHEYYYIYITSTSSHSNFSHVI